ncbi:amphoterin-induced protein 1 [Cygnus atratus]|uniref:amphoterin-induced protein 1 n=1 Tax=Cygnus atratus TaxID=8868 RepID=UPI0015D5A3DE|nr:amphoterin-induced protein 1 [Cygnus atratus]
MAGPGALLAVAALALAAGAAGGSCPPRCVCASNILSCSQAVLSAVPAPLPRFTAVLDLSHNNLSRLRADWAPGRLAHLHALLLSHNGLAFVSTEAFAHVPHLRHLDLSSNRLRALEENLFSDLAELEVLLLYNNEIAAVDRTAFDNLGRLRKLYLGQNHIARFPLELLREGSRLPQLALLDLSANRLRSLPVAELQALPAWLRDRLYLHGNPLACDCPLFQLVARGWRRRLSAVLDFQEELRCLLPAPGRAPVGILALAGRELLNCSEAREAVLEAHLGDTVTLGCDSRLRAAHSRHWVTPGGERVPEEAGNGSAAVLANGSLQLRALRPEDAGTYACRVAGPALNETLYVELLVHNFTLHGPHDGLNTAYTTLVGCILSVVLVLIYLYLTPCRCCCRGADKTPAPRDDSLNSSVLSATPNHAARETPQPHGAAGPRAPPGGQNGRFKAGGTPPAMAAAAAREGPRAQRKVSDPDSVSSVFSDTPIVV